MNKKNLSVVLAGAMLATSVAPVLADTTTAKEYSLDDIKLLENEIVSAMKKELITTNKVFSVDNNKLTDVSPSDANAFVVNNIKNEILGNSNGTTSTSALGVVVLDAKGNKVDLNKINTNITSKEVTYDVKDVEKIFNATGVANLKSGYTVELVRRETSEFFGELLPGIAPKRASDSKIEKYTPATDFANVDDSSNVYKQIVIDSVNNKLLDMKANSNSPLKSEGTGADAKLVVSTNKLKNSADVADGKVAITLTKDSDKIDGRLPLTSDNKLIDYTKTSEINDFDHFAPLETWVQGTEVTTAPKKEAEYKLTAKAENENAVKASDLYDGMVLTAKGTELLSDLTNAAEAIGSTVSDVTEAGTNGGSNTSKALVKLEKNPDFSDKAVYAFTIAYYKNDTEAAAPLAAEKSAPVLLTKADSLPESTKEYIKLLTNGLTSAQKKSITINLVGGESVLSESLVAELEDMGFYVERFGGENREETSIAVAEEIAADTKTNAAFVVGGNGEADAMAISAVAATKKHGVAKDAVAPIIVSSVHGLSEDALAYLKEKSAKGDVKVIGGESVVSASELEAINDSLSLNRAERIAGENRFETNAKIIEKYYKSLGDDSNDASKNKGAEAVLVVKDGVANKGQLVDALAAANYAAAKNAPIVLASSSLNATQKNALLKVDIVKGNKAGNDTENSMKQAVQVGQTSERSALEAVAKLFNLKNN